MAEEDGWGVVWLTEAAATQKAEAEAARKAEAEAAKRRAAARQKAEAARKARTAKTAAFEPAATFSGARPGRVFKSGAQGLGYYCAAAVAAQTTAPRRCTHARAGLS